MNTDMANQRRCPMAVSGPFLLSYRCSSVFIGGLKWEPRSATMIRLHLCGGRASGAPVPLSLIAASLAAKTSLLRYLAPAPSEPAAGL
jgi:hypothetical protein